jgi:hypothetical protein
MSELIAAVSYRVVEAARIGGGSILTVTGRDRMEHWRGHLLEQPTQYLVVDIKRKDHWARPDAAEYGRQSVIDQGLNCACPERKNQNIPSSGPA